MKLTNTLGNSKTTCHKSEAAGRTDSHVPKLKRMQNIKKRIAKWACKQSAVYTHANFNINLHKPGHVEHGMRNRHFLVISKEQ